LGPNVTTPGDRSGGYLPDNLKNELSNLVIYSRRYGKDVCTYHGSTLHSNGRLHLHQGK
jgi:hypothetical protein